MSKKPTRKQQLFLSAAALFLGQVMYMYYVGARAVSLRTILEGFGAGDYYSLTIVLGSMAMSVMLPLGGKLGDMFGRKKLFAIGMIGFLASEVILAAAQRYLMVAFGIVLCGAAYGLSWVQNAALIVDIYPEEAQPRILGGAFLAIAAPSFKEKDRMFLSWCEKQLYASGARVCLNTEVTQAMLDELKADEVVVATGAAPRKLPIPGMENTIEAVDYLLGKREVGQTVAVIGGAARVKNLKSVIRAAWDVAFAL